MFGLGLGLAFLAVASPIDALGEQQFFFVAHAPAHPARRPGAAVHGRRADRARCSGPCSRSRSWRSCACSRTRSSPSRSGRSNLLLWHLPFAYQGALHHDAVHAAQHILFFTCGALMWAPVLEVLPAPEWFGTGAKLGYIVAVRLVETVLGNVFVWSGGVFYHVLRPRRSSAGGSRRTPTRGSPAG